MNDDLGVFPFGQPNVIRPMRRPDVCDALVVGVYPSAFHVAWSPPPDIDPRPAAKRTRPFISSLAVDVEPTVFWNGVEPHPTTLLANWREAVGFDSERHGTVRRGHNGPSGDGLTSDVLTPLGLTPHRVAFTDAVPCYFVKHERGGQAAAIAERFNPIAEQLGIPRGHLPRRPTERQLVELATTSDRRHSLRRELLAADTGLVITLGNEALAVIRSIADSHAGLVDSLTPTEYGRTGTITIDGRRLDMLAMCHPGFQRQTKDPRWLDALEDWRTAATDASTKR